MRFATIKLPTKAKRPPLLRQESIHLSPKKHLPSDPRTGKSKFFVFCVTNASSKLIREYNIFFFKYTVKQEKNQYAMNVWRRVRAKLESRDMDHSDGRKLSVQEQVK